MTRLQRFAAVVVLLVAWPAARIQAQNDITIYRCVDPAGAVTLQNDVPCPKGSTQTIRKVGVLPTLPAPEVAAPKPAAAKPAPTPAATPEAAPAPQVRNPPPALFQCRSWDDRDYLGDTSEPSARCVPLETVGIDGSPALAAGQACEMRRDDCVAVPVEQLCAAWKRRMDEAEFRWKFGGGRNDERKTEFDRVAKTYRESTCVDH